MNATKPTPKHYRQAAELIFNHKAYFACEALNKVDKKLGWNHFRFAKHFSADEPYGDAWLRDANDFETNETTPLGRKIRIMALLFMGYIVECESKGQLAYTTKGDLK